MLALRQILRTKAAPAIGSRQSESTRRVPDVSRSNSVWQSLAVRPGAIQPKLTVSEAGDPQEREADQIADQVMNVKNAPADGRGVSTDPKLVNRLQRKCNECEEEEEQQLQRKELDQAPDASAVPPIVYHALGSPGQALDPDTRGFMESRFGHDFGDVRVHADAQAAESARAVNALAYTVGSDIVLDRTRHAPETAAGRKVLAHELTHVVQQSTGLQRNVLQRWALSNCNQAKSAYVEDAFSKSFDDLSKAVSMLTPPTTPFVKNAMYLAFRDDSEATANKLRKDIGKLKQNIRSTHVTCQPSTHPDCGTDFGYHQGGEIYLCMPTFLGPDHGPIQQANTLTHEAVHKYLDVRDTGYFTKEACEETPARAGAEDKDSGTAGDNPVHRFNNADAYACFVHFLVRRSVASVEASADAYRGRLELEAKDKRIYTVTGTPSRDDGAFRMKGAPPNSGFRYRWRLFSAGEQLPLAAMNNSRANPSVFNDDVTVVYVPTESRQRLGQKKATKANMVIEVQVFKPDEKGTYVPPTKVFLLDLQVEEGQDPFDTSKV